MSGAKLSHINAGKCARELREEYVLNREPVEVPVNRKARGKVRFIR